MTAERNKRIEKMVEQLEAGRSPLGVLWDENNMPKGLNLPTFITISTIDALQTDDRKEAFEKKAQELFKKL